MIVSDTSYLFNTRAADAGAYGLPAHSPKDSAEATRVVGLRDVTDRTLDNTARVLVVDDDPVLLAALPETLRLRMSGVIIDTTDSASTALDRIATCDYDVIVSDIKMPGMDGLALLTEIRTRRPDTPTLLITGHGDHGLAVDALRRGAFDFIQKPIDRDYFIAALRRAIEAAEETRRARAHKGALEHRAKQLEQRIAKRTQELRDAKCVLESPLKWLIAPSRQMNAVVQQIRHVASSPLTVLIQGETGTGKELVARAIHHLSPRRSRCFVAVDCGAIPDTLIESELFGYEKGAFSGAHQRTAGKFQLAQKGTLFLDEITNLPLGTQSKLLRVVQERQLQPLGTPRTISMDTRIIAASNASLDAEVQSGRFRQDLYYRLNEFVINLPPLRLRDDIMRLASEFVAEASVEFGRPCREISDAAAEVLRRHAWPGNVRELRNTIRRAVLLASDVILPEHFSFIGTGVSRVVEPPDAMAGHDRSLREIAAAAVAAAESQAIRHALDNTNGNKSESARLLRTDYKTLHLKMKQYGISTTKFRRTSR